MEAPTTNFKFLILFIVFILFIICTSGSFHSDVNEIVFKQLKRADEETLHLYHRELIQRIIQHDFMNPPITTYPTTPVTNPVTTPAIGTGPAPPDTSTPPIITVPTPIPITATPTPVMIPPTTNPISPPIPVTNPVITPSTTVPGGGQPINPGITPVMIPPTTNPINPPIPVTNPVTTPSTTIPGGGQPINPGITPVIPPPVTSNAPALPGQSWCVARGGMPESVIQTALDYACGIGGADCSPIQQGASCYNPNTLENHASYAFNSYYQRNPVQTSCDFGGAAMITNLNPSTGSCVFTTWSSSSTSPATTSPFTTPIPTTTSPVTPIPTPTTDSSSGATPGLGTPPNVLSASNPALGGGTGVTGYGEGRPTASISSASTTSSLQPFIGCILVAIYFITRRTVLDI